MMLLLLGFILDISGNEIKSVKQKKVSVQTTSHMVLGSSLFFPESGTVYLIT